MPSRRTTWALRGKDIADRVDFYLRQRVTEAEFYLAFALFEKADRDLAADLKIYGNDTC